MVRWVVLTASLMAAAPAWAGERIWEDLGYTTSADLAAVATLIGTAAVPSEAGTRVITYWEASDRVYRCIDELLPDAVWGGSTCQMVRKDME